MPKQKLLNLLPSLKHWKYLFLSHILSIFRFFSCHWSKIGRHPIVNFWKILKVWVNDFLLKIIENYLKWFWVALVSSVTYLAQFWCEISLGRSHQTYSHTHSTCKVKLNWMTSYFNKWLSTLFIIKQLMSSFYAKTNDWWK